MPSKEIEWILTLFSKEEYQKALENLEELIINEPNDSLLFNIRGACYAGLTQVDLAKENYKKAITLNPEYAKAHYNLAGLLHELDDFDASIKSYENALVIEPDHAEAHNNLGNVFKDTGQLDAAINSYEKAILINPDYIEAHYNLGSSLYDSGELEDAVRSYKKVAQLKPNTSSIHNNLGNILRELGRLDEAVISYEKAIVIEPNFAEVYYNLGIIFQELNNLNNFLKNYKKAIELKANYPEALNNIGAVYKELEEFDSAVKFYKKAIEIKPDYAEVHNNLGILYKDLEKFDDSIQSFNAAIEIMPDYAEAQNNLGIIYMESGQLDMSIKCYKNAIDSNKNFIQAINNLGITFMNLGEIDEALDYFKKALKINPNDSLTLNNLGVAHKRLDDFESAKKYFEKGIALDPNYSDTFSNYGNLLTDLDNFEQALINYHHSYEINPNSDYIEGNIIHTKMHLCIWDDLSKQIKDLKYQINDGHKRIDAFSFMALIDDPKLQKKVTEIYLKDRFPKSDLLPNINIYPKHKKIRIGYFSGDFREHPVSTLTANLYEIHNRDKFEIHAFSYGPDTQDEMNLRIRSGVDHFHQVCKVSHKDIVLLARSLEIDIAIDLGGFTVSGKTDLFAMSAAPIQLTYIGFLGTMGAPYYDYLIADEICIPKENQQYYTEKIAYLPTYQVNDSKQSPPKIFLTRNEIGLPEKGFVFCCFNNTYKITPTTFESWMKILKNVEDSVLLIYVELESARENLKIEVTKKGLDPDRLIFAKHLERDQYLARYRLVDLFLDTLPYNAATTASDALRMELPVLTCQGDSFASRVASSIINAVNLPELITYTQQEYESVAIELATNPEKFKAIKAKLKENLSTAPLYNTAKFTENLESVYEVMYERYHDGLELNHIYINNSE